MKINIILFNGCDEMDALAPYEVLRRAAKLVDNWQVQLVTLERKAKIVTAHGVHLHPHGIISAKKNPDVLIVPGGGWNDKSANHSTRTELQRGVIPQKIAQLHTSGTLIAGVCTGAMLMAEAGILKGRHAITHQGAVDDLKSAGAIIIDARVVDDGDIITSGGVTSGLDLALWLVERLASAQVAQKLEVQMEYERRGTVWRCE